MESSVILTATCTLMLPFQTGPDGLAETNSVKATTHIPRGLMVRIRRSHRRRPGSIPGVGICFLLFWLSIQRANRKYTVLAIFKTIEAI